MKVATFIKKLLPYADKDLMFSTGTCSVKRLLGPKPIDDYADVTDSGIYVLPSYVEVYLEVGND